jgi:hypothetical protein
MPPKAVFDVAKAAALHRGGVPLSHIAKLPDMPSLPTVKRHLLAAGNEVWTGPWKLRFLTKEVLYDLHHTQDMPAEEIGGMLGCGASTVRRRAQELGIAKGSGKSKAATGERHWSWRGGRFVDRGGYVRVRCPQHPNANRNGYVLEHRKVAADALGRPLLSTEEVHHIDGNKQNNAPANLLVVPRGKHQKLHADVCRELNSLRQEVARLSGTLANAQQVYGPLASWRIVG